jgi:ribose transport system substrate-binding protein
MITHGAKIRLIGLATLAAFAAKTTIASAEETTPFDASKQKCDATLTVEDLGKIHPPKAKKHFKIALVQVTLSGYFSQAWIYGAEKAANEAGVDFTVGAGQGFSTSAQQVTQTENAIARGADAVVLDPADVNGTIGAVDLAVAKNIPFISAGTLVNSPKAIQIAQEDYVDGQTVANHLLKALPNGGDGIVIGGPANESWARQRVAGLVDGLKKDPKFVVAAITNEISPAEGVAKFNNAVQAHPKVDWIYSVYNLFLLPSAIPEKYRSSYYVAGGFEPATVEGLKNGTVKAVAPNFGLMSGFVGVTYAVRALNGEALPKMTCMPNTIVSPDGVDDPHIVDSNLYPKSWSVPSR